LLETRQSAATYGAHDESDTGTASTVRLVIRARILPDTQPANIGHSESSSWAPIALIVGAIVLLAAVVIAISVFRREQPTAARSQPVPQAHEAARVPPPPVQPAPAPAAVQAQPDPSRTIHEVMPAASRNSLQTIRGTIRVVIRVLVNPDGTVRAATSHIGGPSRYFERVALQAAKQWTFAPTDAKDPRTFLVKFNFTRSGVIAGADTLDKTP
jgi:TonB family protein